MLQSARRTFLFSVGLFMGTLTPAFAHAPALPEPATKTSHFEAGMVPPAPNIGAKNYILMDADSGKILAQKNADDTAPPASLTKMMSMYVVSNALQSGRIHLNDEVHVSENAWHMQGSRMFLKSGQSVSVENLVQGMIVQSGNDACVAMAEFLGGQETTFSRWMNQQAQAIGMHHSHFVNSTGLPDANHYTTAHDMALLAQALIRDFPEYYHWYRQKWFTYNDIRQPNRNRLLWWDESVDGLKTGHTDAAGYCLTASAKRDGMRLIAVVMGTKSDTARAQATLKLLNYGFRFYETHRLYRAGQTLTQARVWKGQDNQTPLGVRKDLWVTIPRGLYSKLSANMQLKLELQAPIVKGQAYGNVQISLDGTPYQHAPLIALAPNPQTNVVLRAWDGMRLSLHRLFS